MSATQLDPKSVKKPARRRKGKRRSEAARADKYQLYQAAVQDPEADVEFIQHVYERHNGQPARTLCEDFSGTFEMACRWAAAHLDNHALAIDLDSEPLEWGRKNNLSRLRPKQARRVEVIQGDVRDASRRRVDCIAAFNFSFFIFKDRGALVDYFAGVRKRLRKRGLFFLDAYGGPDSYMTMCEPRDEGGFEYVWDQARFDPVNHHATNYIHFHFEDGSSLERAFTYEWRVWTVPELRDALLDAGFRSVEVYWEGIDKKTGEGNGVYRKVTSAHDDPSWVSYIVGVR